MAVVQREGTRLLSTISQWCAIAVCVVSGVILFKFVDLTPKVQPEFFFSTEDPQLQSSIRIENQFGTSEQVFIAARSKHIVSKQYLSRVYELTRDLIAIKVVADVRSLTHGPEPPEEILEEDPEEVYEDLLDSPFWTSLLLAPDRSATFLIVRFEDGEQEATVRAVDRVLDRHSTSRAGIRICEC